MRSTPADKAALIASSQQNLTQPAVDAPDPALGRAVFAKTCQQCHTLYGVGANIGPDLTGSNRSDVDYLLSNIVDPSAVIAKEYQPTVIITTDGRVVTGIVIGRRRQIGHDSHGDRDGRPAEGRNRRARAQRHVDDAGRSAQAVQRRTRSLSLFAYLAASRRCRCWPPRTTPARCSTAAT